MEATSKDVLLCLLLAAAATGKKIYWNYLFKKEEQKIMLFKHPETLIFALLLVII